MLFNSPEFLLIFLPATLAAFALFGSTKKGGLAVLLLASAIFYGQWSFLYLGLLIVLMSANFLIGQGLINRPSQMLLAAGITLNLCVLGYFKYYGFFAEQIGHLLGLSVKVTSVVLPLGISFFIFQKIAYLVDCYRKQVPPHSYWSFSLFVLFFPQLIAGPITHAREIIPQFVNIQRRNLMQNLAVGITIFTIGLCKKMLIADNAGLLVGPVFDNAAASPPTFIAAWFGVVAFALQIYFDFSGYSDMAIGLAYMFGIRLPVNFASPYKALSITEFWRRWHITLSRFLRDYLYIPLGGNRRGRFRQYVNLLVTMALAGLWHGAGWTFVLWGILHGLCLAVHKLWLKISPVRMPRYAAWILTFTITLMLWVPFRAPSIEASVAVWNGLLGLNGVALPMNFAKAIGGDFLPRFIEVSELPSAFPRVVMVVWIPLGLVLTLLAPNTQTIMKRYKPVLIDKVSMETKDDWATWGAAWQPTAVFGILMGGGLAACMLKFNDISRFIYFQF